MVNDPDLDPIDALLADSRAALKTLRAIEQWLQGDGPPHNLNRRLMASIVKTRADHLRDSIDRCGGLIDQEAETC